MNNLDLSLYLVTDRRMLQQRSLVEVVEQAIKGGVSVVQLREKDSSSREFYEIGKELQKILSPLNVPLIINDRVDLALALNADGVHIGQNDLPYAETRRLLGPNKIIGLSVETREEALAANLIDVDYIGLSPIFETPTKTDTNKPLELKGIKEIASFTTHPTVAIGGINLDNTTAVIKNGANGIAVVSAIMAAQNPRLAAQQLQKKIKEGSK